MKQSTKPKSQRSSLTQQFKQKCKEILKQEPKNYLITSLKDTQLVLDLTCFTPEDLPFFQIMLALPLQKVVISTPDPSLEKSPGKGSKKDPLSVQVKSFPETAKFREFMGMLGQAIQINLQLKIVRIERVPLSLRALSELNEAIKKTHHVRELAFIGCGLTDDHLESIKLSLAQNKSLLTLNLSQNTLTEVGGMIGHILSEHSRRRNQIIFFLNIRGEMPIDDLSNTGLCQINLESNRLTDKSIQQLVTYLKNDSWTKCLNLRHNLIKTEGIKQLALMLKNNVSLISLDLRGNEGLSKEYSRYIYKKLVLNMEKYKQQKQIFSKTKQTPRKHDKHTTPQKHHNKKQRAQSHVHLEQEAQKYKSVKDSHSHYFGRYDSKEYTTIAQPPRQIQTQKNNMTLDRKIKINIDKNKPLLEDCLNCKSKTFKMLRLEKKNLDLELQLRKVKHALLTKNIDISAILPNANVHNQSALELLSNKSTNQNDDELLQRMEQIMLELTRVIETIEEHQHTKVNISNPLDNPNSFSNTLQLYTDKNSNLQDLSKSIEQEERLQAMFGGNTSLEHQKSDTPEH